MRRAGGLERKSGREDLERKALLAAVEEREEDLLSAGGCGAC